MTLHENNIFEKYSFWTVDLIKTKYVFMPSIRFVTLLRRRFVKE